MSKILEKVTKRVKKFIQTQWDRKNPLLLGYSGGPDSKALLHCLLEAEVAPLHLAHVDHGWRSESQAQAQMLEAEAKQLGLPFHTVRLQGKALRNAEDRARQDRLSFFQELFEQIPFQALLLAHHRDDMAETAFKRLLEGAHLPNLGGLAPVTSLGALTVWRPLLEFRKAELLQLLESRSLSYLEDPSNEDRSLLRSRLRHEMLPQLAKTFGKEVSENLAQLSERAGELRDYLERQVGSVWESGQETGVFHFRSLRERLEIRYLVQKIFRRAGRAVSRHLIEDVVDAVLSRGRKVSFSTRQTRVEIEGGVLRIIEDLL